MVVWSVILLLAYREAPRVLPSSSRLARFGVGCVALMIPATLEMWISGRYESHEISPQGTLAKILITIGGAGAFTGLVCLSIAFIRDGLRTPPA
jgi:hypothetical protein